jgi:hypothetical protein
MNSCFYSKGTHKKLGYESSITLSLFPIFWRKKEEGKFNLEFQGRGSCFWQIPPMAQAWAQYHWIAQHSILRHEVPGFKLIKPKATNVTRLPSADFVLPKKCAWKRGLFTVYLNMQWVVLIYLYQGANTLLVHIGRKIYALIFVKLTVYLIN